MSLPAHATDFFVDKNHPSASDNNNGSESSPWATMYAIQSASLRPGDTVIVKSGVYDVRQGGTWDSPAIQPSASGTSASPITLVAQPRHSVILDGGRQAGALIGTDGADHIVIDGFVVRNATNKGVAIFRSNSVVIQNNIIHNIVNNADGDNTEAIRVENATGTRIINNLLYDITNNSSWNASGIKQYHTRNSIIENNEIHGTSSGIYDKNDAVGSIIRRNHIHDVQHGLLLLIDIADTRIYENLILNTENGLNLQNENSRPMRNISFYNNVVANYSNAAISSIRFPNGSIRFWNNIIAQSGQSPASADVLTYDDPNQTIQLSDYNLFPSNVSFIAGRYSSDRNLSSLSAWTNYSGLDGASQASNPQFDQSSGMYRLSSSSPAIGAGRSDGTSSGSVVDMGAYPTGSGTVGLLGSFNIVIQSASTPMPPSNLN